MDEASAVRFERFARLRDASWSYLLGVCFFILCVGAVIQVILPSALGHLAARASLFALPLPLLAKVLAGLPVFVTGARTADREPVGVASLWRACAGPLAAACRCQWSTLRGFMSWLRRARPFTRPEGEAFGFIERSSYSTFVAICLLSTLVDLPLNGLILSVLVKDPHKQHVLHLILGPLAVLTLVWVLGDRWLMRASSHVVTADTLDLKLAARVECRVPLAAIERCETVAEPYLSWCARHHVRRRCALVVTPLDRPNVLLVLKPLRGADAGYFGAQRAGLPHLFVYVDSPSQFIEAVRRRLPAAA